MVLRMLPDGIIAILTSLQEDSSWYIICSHSIASHTRLPRLHSLSLQLWISPSSKTWVWPTTSRKESSTTTPISSIWAKMAGSKYRRAMLCKLIRLVTYLSLIVRRNELQNCTEQFFWDNFVIIFVHLIDGTTGSLLLNLNIQTPWENGRTPNKTCSSRKFISTIITV